MRNLILLMSLFVSALLSAQEKNFLDTAYIETFATIDTLITPDRINMGIILNETDSRGKKSTEDLEKAMERELLALGIDTGKDLTLLDFNSNYRNYFLRGQNILKTKAYSLLVRDAATAAKVLVSLEAAGISNVAVENTEYSKLDSLLLEMKRKAVLKAKQQADYMVEPLGRKTGKVLHVTDNNSSVLNALNGQVSSIILRGTSSYGNRAPEPLAVEFKKIKYEVRVDIKFAID